MFDTHIFSFEHSEMYKNSILRTPSSSCSLQLLVKYCQTLTSINALNKSTTFLVSNGDHNYDENDDLFWMTCVRLFSSRDHVNYLSCQTRKREVHRKSLHHRKKNHYNITSIDTQSKQKAHKTFVLLLGYLVKVTKTKWSLYLQFRLNTH